MMMMHSFYVSSGPGIPLHGQHVANIVRLVGAVLILSVCPTANRGHHTKYSVIHATLAVQRIKLRGGGPNVAKQSSSNSGFHPSRTLDPDLVLQETPLPECLLSVQRAGQLIIASDPG